MRTIRSKSRRILAALFLSSAALAPAGLARAGDPLPITGLPRAELAAVDTLMTTFMDANNIRGGVLGIMRNGVVIYQRGFGYHDANETIAMPENSLVRIASVAKPITAAAIQTLISDGAFVAGDNIFNINGNGGVLNVSPSPSLGDNQLAQVTVQQCLTHQGGWDRSVAGDLTRQECTVASSMNVTSPPGRVNTMDWILGNPLQFTPGSLTQMYSNEGYLALGLVVDQESGMPYIDFIRSRVLTPNMWIPWTDIRIGEPFPENQPVREAWYDSTNNAVCKYQRGNQAPCNTNVVEECYGGRDFKGRIGPGAIVASAATLLRLAETYNVGTYNNGIGQLLGGVRINANKNGGNDGVNTFLQQRTDGVNFFVFFNQRSGGTNFGNQFATQLNTLLNSQASWPTLPVDGFWVHRNLGAQQGLYGSYNRPLNQMTEALTPPANQTPLGNGSIVNLLPGASTWTGTIDKKLLIRAPVGNARLGG